MKPSLLIAVALCCAASSHPTIAEPIPSGVMLSAPRTGEEALNHIQLKVAMKELESVLTALYENQIERTAGPQQTFATDEEEKRWHDRLFRKEAALKEMRSNLSEMILKLMPAEPAKTEKP